MSEYTQSSTDRQSVPHSRWCPGVNQWYEGYWTDLGTEPWRETQPALDGKRERQKRKGREEERLVENQTRKEKWTEWWVDKKNRESNKGQLMGKVGAKMKRWKTRKKKEDQSHINPIASFPPTNNLNRRSDPSLPALRSPLRT